MAQSTRSIPDYFYNPVMRAALGLRPLSWWYALCCADGQRRIYSCPAQVVAALDALPAGSVITVEKFLLASRETITGETGKRRGKGSHDPIDKEK